MAEPVECESVRDVLPELAAGVAPGDVRAKALAHLARCPACRKELAEIAGTLDELLLLAPEHEPPPGFDVRVLDRINAERPQRHLTRNSLMLAAALVLVAAAAVGITWSVGSDDRNVAAQYRDALAVADGAGMHAADITANGRTYGDVFVYDGHPSWLFLTMRAPGSGSYPVRLVTKDGTTTQIGTCTLHDGVGHWGTTLDVPVGSIAQVELTRAGWPAMVADFS
jgi:hypothetical protein